MLRALLIALLGFALCQQYHLEGVFTIPYHNIVEPFVYDLDDSIPASWVSYYGGVNTLLMRLDKNITYDYHVQKNAYHCVASAPDPTALEEGNLMHMLPDLTTGDWTYMGLQMIRNINCKHYQQVLPEGTRTGTYDYFINALDDTPVQFLIHGYNVVDDSHYDVYYFDFYAYSPLADTAHFVPTALCKTKAEYVEERTYMPYGYRFATFVNNVVHHPTQSLASLKNAKFNSFAAKYGKNYANEQEYNTRQQIYESNLELIKSHNRRNAGYTLAMNKFGDWTFEEFKAMYLNTRVNLESHKNREVFTAQANAVVPKAIDWRLRSAVTPVKDQGICGSCWAFGTIGTTEGRYAIKSGNLTAFSEQNILDCFWDKDNNGCNGGEPDDALEFLVKQKHLYTEVAYPYKMIDDFCKNPSYEGATVPGPKKWVNIKNYDEAALQQAVAQGPVVINVDVTNAMVYYSSGVFSDPECKTDPNDLDHSITIVGYGEEAGQQYWVVKNSWSSYWGVDGYLYIARNKGNMCGIATDSSFPVFD